MKEYQLIASYLLGKYYVSTAFRECSADTPVPIWYFETIVWEWDKDTKKTGHILNMSESDTEAKAIENHFTILRNLHIKRP